MKTLIKSSGLLLFVLLLNSCGINQPISTLKPSNNETYAVDYLFEHDGCKVYRFQDMGRWVYFTNCSGDVTSFQNDSTHTRVINTTRKNPTIYRSGSQTNAR
ncbi:MAG TPA: DUF4884 domain-containing protein [Prolixibacteraceae bacterium]|jgi:hypothetical protein|nr:DUF4884 domain-containing protein [Prolixibacteraceae bacterium]